MSVFNALYYWTEVFLKAHSRERRFFWEKNDTWEKNVWYWYLGEKCFPSTLFFKFHIEKTQKNGTPRRQKVLKSVHPHNTKVNFYKILSKDEKVMIWNIWARKQWFLQLRMGERSKLKLHQRRFEMTNVRVLQKMSAINAFKYNTWTSLPLIFKMIAHCGMKTK